MPPKPDPDEKKFLYMKVVGGEVTSAAALAPKCGPIGLPPKKVGEDIQKATTDPGLDEPLGTELGCSTRKVGWTLGE